MFCNCNNVSQQCICNLLYACNRLCAPWTWEKYNVINAQYYYYSILLKETCVFAKCDQFLPVRSHFDTKRPVNFFHIATFPSPTFGPLFAFHCPLFFTKNNNLECHDVLKTVTVTSDQKRFGPYTAHN